jgi:hypothetical protein
MGIEGVICVRFLETGMAAVGYGLEFVGVRGEGFNMIDKDAAGFSIV